MNTAAAWQINCSRGSTPGRPMWIGAVVRIAAGLGLLAAVVAGAIPQDLFHSLGDINPPWLGQTFFLYAASPPVRGARWWFLTRPLGGGAHWLDVSSISMLGWSLNMLPFRIGDAVRRAMALRSEEAQR